MRHSYSTLFQLTSIGVDTDSLDIVRFVKLNYNEGIFAIVGVHDAALIPVHSILRWGGGEIAVREDRTLGVDRCNSCNEISMGFNNNVNNNIDDMFVRKSTT